VAVEDDGEGMGRDDALAALERHATSKLVSADDLERIGTLGFRGEALPSIASVSRFRLLTRPEGAAEGTEVVAEGGRIVSAEARGAARGTRVEVADLFFNVPARRKFLKSDATELRACVEIVTQLALAHPEAAFELRSGERVLLAVPPDQPVEERVREVVGAEAPTGIHWARAGSGGWGYALAFAAPHEGRGHRKGLRLFVNGRPVQDRLLLRALLEGYRGLLESGRYPVATLFVQVPPEEVDVNVHPAKREVRFRDEGRVFRWVAGRTAEALSTAPWAGPGGSLGADLRERPSAGWGAGARPAEGSGVARVAGVAEALGEYARRAGAAGAGFRAPGPGTGALFARRGHEGEPPAPPAGRFGRLRPLGAFDATYLLFEDEDSRELVLFDQHAAHERILYEELLAQAEGSDAKPQPLLFPATVECSASERAAFEERRAVLDRLGFRVEPFGPAALAVTAAPRGLTAAAAEAAVRDLLSGEGEGGGEGRDGLEAAARRAACAAAVKARSALVGSEVAELLRRLEGLRNPSHCPHGRPLLVRLSRREIEALFHRA
jgi:DNA mismatch repair protein MutL